MGNSYNIKSRIWIRSGQDTLLGEGRIDLLKRIDEFGSISKAAKSMSMSYKKAWELVNSMNTNFSEPLVVGSVGGVNGGGSELSDSARQLIEVFNELEAENRKFLEEKMAKFDLFK